MKLSELTKFSISLTLVPIIPSWLIYKYICPYGAGIFLALCWLLALISFCNKKIASDLKSLFGKIGAFLGKHIANIILFLIFIIAVIPTKILMSFAKRDRLKRRSFEEETYWLDYGDTKHDYELEY